MTASRVRAPVFVVGSPRAGTSLLRRRLDQHPHLAIVGETHFFSILRKIAWRFGDLRVLENRRRLVRHFLSATYLGELDVLRLGQRLEREASTCALFFEVILLEYARQRGKDRCGEKSPDHALYLREILGQFPDSRIVHIVRDPRDVIASLRTMPWASSDIITNALVWKRHVDAAEAHRGQPYYMNIRYEELVTDPSSVFDRICRFLGEPSFDGWASTLVRPPGHRSWWGAASFQRITTAPVGRWQRELDPQEVALVERITRSQMKAFGYVPTTTRRASAKFLAGELGRFLQHRGCEYWRSVAWRFDPEPLSFFQRWRDRFEESEGSSETWVSAEREMISPNRNDFFDTPKSAL